MRQARYYLVVVALWVCAGLAHAGMAGPVVAVLDGDTVDVLVDRKPVRVRLAEIDAPEKGQPFGTRSRQALASAVFRQQVTVRVSGNDRYGRTIGTLFLDGVNINHWMVAEGWAWAYRPHVVDRRLFEIEAAAKAAGRGLWSEPEPVPPWEWRRRRP